MSLTSSSNFLKKMVPDVTYNVHHGPRVQTPTRDIRICVCLVVLLTVVTAFCLNSFYMLPQYHLPPSTSECLLRLSIQKFCFRSVLFGCIAFACLSFGGPVVYNAVLRTQELPSVQVPLPVGEQINWDARKEEVRQAFLHAWSGYKKYAFPGDELLPISGGSTNKCLSNSVSYHLGGPP